MNKAQFVNYFIKRNERMKCQRALMDAIDTRFERARHSTLFHCQR